MIDTSFNWGDRWGRREKEEEDETISQTEKRRNQIN